MTDIREHADYFLKFNQVDTSTAHDLVRDLLAALEAERCMRAETQRQLSEFISDFCALRDALPLEQVKQILSKEPAK